MTVPKITHHGLNRQLSALPGDDDYLSHVKTKAINAKTHISTSLPLQPKTTKPPLFQVATSLCTLYTPRRPHLPPGSHLPSSNIDTRVHLAKMCFSCGWPWGQATHLAAPPTRDVYVNLPDSYTWWPDSWGQVSHDSLVIKFGCHETPLLLPRHCFRETSNLSFTSTLNFHNFPFAFINPQSISSNVQHPCGRHNGSPLLRSPCPHS